MVVDSTWQHVRDLMTVLLTTGGHRHADGQHHPHDIHPAQADFRRRGSDGGVRAVAGRPGLISCGWLLPVEEVPAKRGQRLRIVGLIWRVLDGAAVGEQPRMSGGISQPGGCRRAVCAVPGRQRPLLRG